ncbi:hypothetical protein BO82DRAFT_53973 [Aspergillus uvarum CBS 121591]|uniref:Uncharacterized protein n=1 Tax=Aspergillus uvarum CBS 121591 TaxID=1448315 RepID=A0A319D7J4_9EURO|nr:hypothetical protein BO82DRAFT_53973 [Aspergillus uvarum CBS 121591]PYH86913.1 hypothetical protein BO82DRAFT_53973 [Aspergillus uvarum CBS 121591]
MAALRGSHLQKASSRSRLPFASIAGMQTTAYLAFHCISSLFLTVESKRRHYRRGATCN